MRLKLLMVTILVVFSAGIISSVIVIKNNPIPEVDLIAINDVVKTVEKNWGQINEETLHNSNIKQSFSIIDNLENVIYQTPGNHFIDLYEAIKSKDLQLFGTSFRESFEAQVAMFPHMVNPDILEIIETYKNEALGWKLSGAGGGGYLVIVSDKPVQNAIQIRIVRPDY